MRAVAPCAPFAARAQLVMIQCAFTVLVLVATPCGLHFGSVRDVLRWSLTIPLLFTLMLASSMMALDYASMGAIIVVRNIAPIVTMVIERLFQEHIEVSCGVVLSLLSYTAGSDRIGAAVEDVADAMKQLEVILGRLQQILGNMVNSVTDMTVGVNGIA